jgi:hypothetical protein
MPAGTTIINPETGQVTIQMGNGSANASTMGAQFGGGTNPALAAAQGLLADSGVGGGDFATTQAPAPLMPENMDQLIQRSKTGDPDWDTAVDRVGAQITQQKTPSQPVPGGMNWSGGQLRARGVSAGPVSTGPVGTI